MGSSKNLTIVETQTKCPLQTSPFQNKNCLQTSAILWSLEGKALKRCRFHKMSKVHFKVSPLAAFSSSSLHFMFGFQKVDLCLCSLAAAFACIHEWENYFFGHKYKRKEKVFLLFCRKRKIMKDGEGKFTLAQKAEKLRGRILRANTAQQNKKKKRNWNARRILFFVHK